jgi:phosphoribosylformylglycinamidine (FGAM) synthase-like enzyme
MDKYLEKRVNYYLGNLKDKTNVKLDEDDFKNSKENLKKEDKNPTINLYKKQFSELLKKHNFKNKKFLYQFGDIDREIDRYAFAKNRFGNKNNSVIL